MGNNTWASVDMELIFQCLTRQLTSERSERMTEAVQTDAKFSERLTNGQ